MANTFEYVELFGKKYKTVTIGNQTWLAENLDVDTYSSVKCYKETDGRLYTWDKAVEIANSIEGWHLPTTEEWDELYRVVGRDTNKMKSELFGGTDNYGFGVLPAGYYYGSSYDCVGTSSNFWTSDEYDNFNAYSKFFNSDSNMFEDYYDKACYTSVRLVKDN